MRGSSETWFPCATRIGVLNYDDLAIVVYCLEATTEFQTRLSSRKCQKYNEWANRFDKKNGPQPQGR